MAAAGMFWTESSLPELVLFLRDQDHPALRHQLNGVALQFDELATSAPPDEARERLQRVVVRLSDHLLPHMLHEDNVLYPAIELLTDEASEGDLLPGDPLTLSMHLHSMMEEHDSVMAQMRQIRQMMADFHWREDESSGSRNLLAALEQILDGLERHLTLENSVLCPRAMALEAERSGLSGLTAVTDVD